MEEQISSVLITKNADNKYETRLQPLLSRRDCGRESKKGKRKTSKIVDRMGGEFVLEALLMYFAKSIVCDSDLAPVFGTFTVEQLVQLLRDLMCYALSDSFETIFAMKKAHKSKVLKKLCRLGLMDETIYFDSMATHFLDSMRLCTFKDSRTVLQLGNRFHRLRVALQQVAVRMEVKKAVVPATIFSFLWKGFSQCTRRSHNAVDSGSPGGESAAYEYASV